MWVCDVGGLRKALRSHRALTEDFVTTGRILLPAVRRSLAATTMKQKSPAKLSAADSKVDAKKASRTNGHPSPRKNEQTQEQVSNLRRPTTVSESKAHPDGKVVLIEMERSSYRSTRMLSVSCIAAMFGASLQIKHGSTPFTSFRVPQQHLQDV